VGGKPASTDGKIMKRREFLKTSLTVSSLASLSSEALAASAAQPPAGNREYYELRAYHLAKEAANRGLLDAYLEKAAIPAFNRLGLKPVGVFAQQERTGEPGRDEVRDPNVVFVLIPYPSLQAFATACSLLENDAQLKQAGADYLQTPKTAPAFERIESWLLLAFAGMPKIELPPYSRDNKPRMFEIRTYESYSELKALKKIDMFNSGEIDTMREVGLAPIFYGQALVGPNLPHLTYLLSAEDQDAHKKHWGDFGKHPVWNKLKSDHQYDDTVSRIVNRFLVPKPYSQI
jgi:hypothetical protein